MNKFQALIDLAETLQGPDGCPWDKEQTFQSLQPYLLEETHELLEAVDLNEDAKIIEELGDLLYIIIFYGKIAEKEKRFSLEQVLDDLKEKLIRRHPHVFGKIQARNIEEVIKHWEEVKQQENIEKGRSSLLDGIPPTLPSLAKAQKMIQRLKKTHFPLLDREKPTLSSEEEFTNELMDLIYKAQNSAIDLESSLRKSLDQLEQRFRVWEQTQGEQLFK